MYWVNGILKSNLPLNNRSIHFGDGFFTTMRLQQGKVHFLNKHMNRLVVSAKRLMFTNVNFALLYKEILQVAANKIDGIIKVIISRDSEDNQGYSFSDNHDSKRIIHFRKFSQRYIKWYENGIQLKTSIIRLSRNPLLAGIKHLNRLEQIMISYYLKKDKKIHEALVLDTHDMVVECCSANIFWRKGNRVFTPSLIYSGVNGIIRQIVIQLLPIVGYSITEIITYSEHLKDSDEVFVTNALFPIISVNKIDNIFFSSRKLFSLLTSYLSENIFRL